MSTLETEITDLQSQVCPDTPGHCDQCFPGGSRALSMGHGVGTGQRQTLESEDMSAKVSGMKRTLCPETAAAPCTGGPNGGF